MQPHGPRVDKVSMAEAAVVQLLFFTGGTGKMLAALEHLRDVITTWRKKQLNVYVSLSKKKATLAMYPS